MNRIRRVLVGLAAAGTLRVTKPSAPSTFVFTFAAIFRGLESKRAFIQKHSFGVAVVG